LKKKKKNDFFREGAARLEKRPKGRNHCVSLGGERRALPGNIGSREERSSSVVADQNSSSRKREGGERL